MVFLFLALGQAVGAEPTLLYGGALSFEPPRELYSITPEALHSAYLLAQSQPQYVFRNRQGDVSVAFDHLDKPVTRDELQAFRDRLKAELTARWPQLEWLDSRMTQINGDLWFELEFNSEEQGFKVHNWLLGTPLQGRLLAVSMNAFVSRDPGPANQLLYARYSLRLKHDP